jgi:heme-degrading monooxygenase HmoA
MIKDHIRRSVMATLYVHHKVEDYAKWRKQFDEMDGLRRSMGQTSARVFHTTSSPNEIAIFIEWPTAEQARAYSQSPELKQGMQKAGVISQPDVLILEDAKEIAETR